MCCHPGRIVSTDPITSLQQYVVMYSSHISFGQDLLLNRIQLPEHLILLSKYSYHWRNMRKLGKGRATGAAEIPARTFGGSLHSPVLEYLEIVPGTKTCPPSLTILPSKLIRTTKRVAVLQEHLDHAL